jgi:spore photoproduct lyase
MIEDFSNVDRYELLNEIIPDIKETRISIKTKKIRNLDGKIEERIYKIGDGSVIKIFDKTPFPTKSTDVVCPHFLELKWANGCPFDCSWCYLQGTFRLLKRKKKPFVKDIHKTIKHLLIFFENVNQQEYILNSGELSDSLLSEDTECPFSQWAIPLFERFKTHKLLFVTKSTRIKNLLNINPHNYVIISFSLNAKSVAEKWENAPKPMDRIKAASELQDRDYSIRLRIDPIVPVSNWRNCYCNLIDTIFSNIEPERITLGSLRGLQSTINQSSDKSWTKYLSERSNWGRKISLNKRFELFSFIKKYLEDEYNFYQIALCKETIEMWQKLKMNFKDIKCNCIS